MPNSADRTVVRILALLLVASACTGPSEAPLVADSPAEQSGGTLRVGVCCLTVDQLEQPNFLDPQIPFSVANAQREFLRCCLARTLLSYTGRATSEGGTLLHPDLATALPEIADDGLTWTFHLRKGLRYAPPLDDVEITTPDIVRAIERVATPEIGTAGYETYFAPIEGVPEYFEGRASTISGLETPDPYTLRVHLTTVTNDLGYRFALPATAPIPPSPADPSARFGAAKGHDDGYGAYLISTGPYMIEGSENLQPSLPPRRQPPASGLVQGESLTLVRNPSWSRDIDDLRKAYVDRIEVRVVKVKQATREIEQGSIDVLLDGQPSPADLDRYEGDPALRDRLFGDRCNFVTFASMRLTAPPFDDVHVRRAANYAFDGDRAARVASDHESPGVGSYRYVPLTHIAPDSTEGGLLANWDPYPFDPAKAREEMARSRYDHDGDGICDDSACRGIATLDTNFGPEAEVDRIWADGFGSIGMALDIQRVAGGRFAKALSDPRNKTQLVLSTSWEAEYPSPEPLFSSAFSSSGIGSAGTAPNFSLCGASADQLAAWGYPDISVPSADAKIDECRSRIGPAQQQCWAELDQLLMLEIVPAIPLSGIEEVRIVSERVTRFSADQPNGTYAALDQIALAAESA
jgi:ABC-type transport system substrate-binding protein